MDSWEIGPFGLPTAGGMQPILPARQGARSSLCRRLAVSLEPGPVSIQNIISPKGDCCLGEGLTGVDLSFLSSFPPCLAKHGPCLACGGQGNLCGLSYESTYGYSHTAQDLFFKIFYTLISIHHFNRRRPQSMEHCGYPSRISTDAPSGWDAHPCSIPFPQRASSPQGPALRCYRQSGTQGSSRLARTGYLCFFFSPSRLSPAARLARPPSPSPETRGPLHTGLHCNTFICTTYSVCTEYEQLYGYTCDPSFDPALRECDSSHAYPRRTFRIQGTHRCSQVIS